MLFNHHQVVDVVIEDKNTKFIWTIVLFGFSSSIGPPVPITGWHVFIIMR